MTRRCDHTKPKGEGVWGPGFTVKLHQDPGACAGKKKGRVELAGQALRTEVRKFAVLSCESHTVWFGHCSCWLGSLVWLGGFANHKKKGMI